MSSLEGLLEDAWAKLKTLARLEQQHREEAALKSAQAAHCLDQLLGAHKTVAEQQSRAAAAEQEAGALRGQLDEERAARAKEGGAYRASQESLGESRLRERVAHSQLEGVLRELEGARTSCRVGAEELARLQAGLAGKQTELERVLRQSEESDEARRRAEQESAARATEAAARESALSRQLGGLQREAEELVGARREDRRRAQEAAAQLEEETALLQRMLASEREAYARLEDEHRDQVCLSVCPMACVSPACVHVCPAMSCDARSR